MSYAIAFRVRGGLHLMKQYIDEHEPVGSDEYTPIGRPLISGLATVSTSEIALNHLPAHGFVFGTRAPHLTTLKDAYGKSKTLPAVRDGGPVETFPFAFVSMTAQVPDDVHALYYFVTQEPVCSRGPQIDLMVYYQAMNAARAQGSGDLLNTAEVDALYWALALMKQPLLSTEAFATLHGLGDLRLIRQFGEALARDDEAVFRQTALAAALDPAERWLDGYSGTVHTIS